MKLTKLLLLILIFFNLILLIIFIKNRTILLDYYPEQNLLVNKNFGFEIKPYHPTDPNTYCFYNILFKVCFRKHL